METNTSKTRHGAALLGMALALPCCDPQLPPSAGDAADGTAQGVDLRIEPAAPLDAVPPILRVHLRGVESEQDDFPAAVVVRGEVGPAHFGQLVRGSPSQALAERLVPAQTWATGDGAIVLAPEVALAAGELYTVAARSPELAVVLRVIDDDPTPQLPRWWPPDGASASATVAVWCGAASLPPLESLVELAPAGVAGTIRTGALADGRGRQCVRFEPTAQPGLAEQTGPLMPPPVWPDEAAPVARLEPRPLERDGSADRAERPACAGDQVALGPTCAWVADDRLLVAGTATPLLWNVLAPGLDQVTAAAADQPFWVHPLPYNRVVLLDLLVADTAGERTSWTVTVRTRSPMAHLVINEVLANPVGAEPAQEWVELYNDGRAPAVLAGYELVDAGGHTPLPGGVLSPGRYALLVNQDYDEEDEFDPAPAAGTLIVRVPTLGKNGLSNQGEPLLLRDGDGRTVSRFPATPKPKSGVSVMRVAPMALDELEDSFVRSPELPNPGGPNLPNG